MRTHIDWRSASRDNYKNFCQKYPTIKLTFDQWRNIIYEFNYSYRNYILETGEKIKMPFGFGEFTINKKKRKKIKTAPDSKEYINLPIDWQKSKEKGKKIYQFNYHTEGYFFGWIWLKKKVKIRMPELWYFKASRTTSRLLSHYLKTDNKYQHIYCQWKLK